MRICGKAKNEKFIERVLCEEKKKFLGKSPHKADQGICEKKNT
jgi:hypothetical protein